MVTNTVNDINWLGRGHGADSVSLPWFFISLIKASQAPCADFRVEQNLNDYNQNILKAVWGEYR